MTWIPKSSGYSAKVFATAGLYRQDIENYTKVSSERTHLPVTVKEIQAGYLMSPYFKDLFLHLAQNKLPNTKLTIR